MASLTLVTDVIPSLNLLLANNFLIKNDVKRPFALSYEGFAYIQCSHMIVYEAERRL